MSVLLVAPSLAGLGGIEASGRLAWEALGRQPGARLLCYGAGAALPDGADLRPVAHASSRLSAVLRAMLSGAGARTVLVWHLRLLKLVPFLRPRGARVALFLHGIEAWRRPDPLTRRLLRRVDDFLTNSAHTWQRFVRHNGEWAGARARTVHLGLGAPLGDAAPPPGPRPMALMLARLRAGEDYKGHREVIDAWPRLLADLPDAELCIVGEGDLRPALEAQARALGRPGAAIRFLGAVSEADKQTLLRRCRCLAMPSRGEGFGLVYLEAMRLGRPCLVGTEDAGCEVVNPPEAGLAAPPGDRAALTAALGRLLRLDEAWAAVSLAARRRYERQFTAAHFQARLAASLAEVGRQDG